MTVRREIAEPPQLPQALFSVHRNLNVPMLFSVHRYIKAFSFYFRPQHPGYLLMSLHKSCEESFRTGIMKRLPSFQVNPTE
jgi:hypothetical protein